MCVYVCVHGGVIIVSTGRDKHAMQQTGAMTQDAASHALCTSLILNFATTGRCPIRNYQQKVNTFKHSLYTYLFWKKMNIQYICCNNIHPSII